MLDTFIASNRFDACLIDERIFMLYPRLQESLKALSLCVIPEPERYKNWEGCEEVLQFFHKAGLNRNSHLLVIGGGALSDLGGFAASVFKRGLLWSLVPTTLLSMIDASIGGKTALNMEGVKNLVGTFYPPQQIHYEYGFLETLSERESRSGMAEAIKYGLIASRSLFHSLECSYLTRSQIEKCRKIKEDIVNQDPRDQSIRHVLNLGHTWGHALEAAVKGTCLHGEAVAVGLCIEASLSYYKGVLAKQDWEMIHSKVRKLGFLSPIVEFDQVASFLYADKKNQGALQCHLLREIGQYPELVPVTLDDFKKAFEWTLRSIPAPI